MHIFIHKSGIMHTMLRYLSAGYVAHTSGTVPMDKIIGVSAKLTGKYETDVSKFVRARRKKKGLGNAVYFCYPTRDGVSFQFFLLLSPGQHFMTIAERPKDASKRRQRLIFDGRYEAIQMPQKGGKNSWTWRMTTQAYEAAKVELLDIVRVKRRRSALKDYIALLERMPGFRGIRRQVLALRRDALKDWQRIHREKTAPLMVAPGGYLRHQKYPQIELNLVVARMQAGKKPIAASWRYTSKNEEAEGDALATTG